MFEFLEDRTVHLSVRFVGFSQFAFEFGSFYRLQGLLDGRADELAAADAPGAGCLVGAAQRRRGEFNEYALLGRLAGGRAGTIFRALFVEAMEPPVGTVYNEVYINVYN